MNTEIELRVCTYSILKNDFTLLVLLPKHYIKLIEETTGISTTTAQLFITLMTYFLNAVFKTQGSIYFFGRCTDICSVLVAEMFLP